MIAVVRERGGNCIDETGVDQTRNLDQFFASRSTPRHRSIPLRSIIATRLGRPKYLRVEFT